jgi:hypothetical protein
MKPTFSILTVLGFTAYAGLAFASFRDAYSVAGQLSVYAYLGMLAYAAIVAASERATSPRGAFAGAFLGLAIAYSIVDVGPGQLLQGSPALDLPHSHIVDLIVGPEPTTQVMFGDDGGAMALRVLERQEVRYISSMHFSVLFGLLGGCLALWRYRVQERWAKRENSGNE